AVTVGVVAALALSPTAVRAQTLDDGVMLDGKELFTGVLYGHDSWSKYWEGTLQRENGNVGTLTTQSVAWSGNYGISSRFNAIVVLPFVSTRASGGTLQPQRGLQDLTLALKARLFEAGLGGGRSLRAFAVGSYSVPVTDYVADLLPLSIGL